VGSGGKKPECCHQGGKVNIAVERLGERDLSHPLEGATTTLSSEKRAELSGKKKSKYPRRKKEKNARKKVVRRE